MTRLLLYYGPRFRATLVADEAALKAAEKLVERLDAMFAEKKTL